MKKLMIILAFVAAFLAIPASASADKDCSGVGSGGLNIDEGECIPFKKARLVKGKAIPPASAPQRVKDVIEAANKIRKKPYKWGGGHGKFKDSGYDCSGAVSYALRGGNFLSKSLSSVGFFKWGSSGPGKWITVYTNKGHAYMVVAGLRFDTANTRGNGPRWSASLRSTPGKFRVRSPKGF